VDIIKTEEVKEILTWYLLGPYLLGAVYMDLRTDRVSNLYILLGYITGCFVNIQTWGSRGIYSFLVNALWPIVLLYILFLIRAVGAGDIKLLSVVSTFLGPSTTIHVVVASVFMGAIISIYKILKQKNMRVGGIFFFGRKYRPRSFIHYTVGIFGAFIYVYMKEGRNG